MAGAKARSGAQCRPSLGMLWTAQCRAVPRSVARALADVAWTSYLLVYVSVALYRHVETYNHRKYGSLHPAGAVRYCCFSVPCAGKPPRPQLYIQFFSCLTNFTNFP